MSKFVIAVLTLAVASGAWAGGVTLGTSAGVSMGDVLGQITGLPFGAVLPGGGLLLVAAVSLAVGIRIVRRKEQRKNNDHPRS